MARFPGERSTMPHDSPKTLSNDEVYAVVAYMLALNDIIPDDTSLDAVSLASVRMPNQDGFVDRWYETEQ